MENPYARLNAVTTFIFDVDGVLTDGRLLITEEGKELRSMNTKDGLAIKWASDCGYRILVFSGGSSEGVVKRMEKLGATQVHMQCKDKLSLAKSLGESLGFSLNECLVMGDDLADFELMKHAGVAVAPSDAAHEVLEIAHFVSSFKGGEGCVREFIEKVMRLHGHWQTTNKINY
jgi:3-deoxy-D-manno-octulosonate 8-phosphate phosphatase (KDO 8-P phosphatase)